MTEAEKEALAAEYALGLLDADQAARCETWLGSDPDFADRVESWRRNMIEIDMAASPEPPTEALWQRIETGIAGPQAQAQAQMQVASSLHGAAAKARKRWSGRLWSHLPAWRALGLTAAAACLALAVALAVQTRDIARTPILVAVMMSDENRPLALVNAFRDGRTELVPLEALSAPEGKSLQVWTLWDRARGPVSVGLLEAMRSVNLTVDGLPATIPEQLFEVTLEPAGGSPTGRPTGPILMKGNAARTEVGT
ncbi:anti-sigma factor [Ancylobacter sp. A5.8]|uniref:anti-sigma factor n=1 Tax=Ancylobacter gelatini TaxID=2919920 RepID=UPI001F4E033D|nr:anti-sigma factor [Ancylobacter gelatini]MCJ8144637.1 anti-sigma factor [Ancylobacter gelatini]